MSDSDKLPVLMDAVDLEKQQEEFVSPAPAEPESEVSDPVTEKHSLGLVLSDKTRTSVTVFCYLSEDDDLELVSPSEIMDEFLKEQCEQLKLKKVNVTASFNVPDHATLMRYRVRATKWDSDAGVRLLIPEIIQQYLWKYHLQTIDLINPITNKKVVVERLLDGSLTENSQQELDMIHPAVISLLVKSYIIQARLSMVIPELR